jgi:hypothetical protein
MKVPFVRTLERCAFQRLQFFFFADAQSKVQNACRTSSPDFPPVLWGKTCLFTFEDWEKRERALRKVPYLLSFSGAAGKD